MSSATLDYDIRPATFMDARAVYHLIRENTENLVPRAMSDVVQNTDRFLVAIGDGGRVVGTVAFAILPEIGDPSRTSVEIQSVCVEESFRRHGIGRALVVAQLRRIHALHPAQVIVLTFTPPFFAQIGFREIDKTTLMHKIYMGCINCTKHESPFTCPEIAMALDTAGIGAAIAGEE
jgi:amino-acid N-acetyltransferase